VAMGSDGSKVVRKTGPGSYTLHRSGVAALMSDLGQVARMARGIPSYQDGKTTGFKLVGVRPGSVLAAMGIRSGDIVRSVNGTVMDAAYGRCVDAADRAAWQRARADLLTGVSRIDAGSTPD
jgi:S1-C subfamily serine protease